MTVDEMKKKHYIIAIICTIITIIICCVPMYCATILDKGLYDESSQYNELADSLLEGHLHVKDHRNTIIILKELDNPYDMEQRDKYKVDFMWDHAYYNEKYYVYFGAAPTIITYIPYKIITGKHIPDYIVTQLYSIFYIIGLFYLFYIICKNFYKKTRFSIYILSSMIFSIISIYPSLFRPTIYNLSIISGISMAVWSITFFIKAVYEKNSENKSIIYAFIGSLFGALTFACRPPIGLANILVIPLLIRFIKERKITKKLIIRMLLVALPYIVVGSLIMIYNYARFENIFEFGQSYQLTVEDQRGYISLSRLNFKTVVEGIFKNFIEYNTLKNTFPYVGLKGVFLNFIILLFPYLFMFDEKYRKQLKNKKIYLLYIVLMIIPFLVTIIDIINSPFLTERYKQDIYYLMVILTFIGIANYFSIRKEKDNKTIIKIMYAIFAISFIKIILIQFEPYDGNFAQIYDSQIHDYLKEHTNNIIK